MYHVERKGDIVVISDWNSKIIYSVSKDSYVVYRGGTGDVATARVGDLTDEKLLIALSNAVKLDL